MLVDEENNLLAVIATNNYGAAYLELKKPVVSVVTAKTLNGAISVFNQARTSVAENNDFIIQNEPNAEPKS